MCEEKAGGVHEMGLVHCASMNETKLFFNEKEKFLFHSIYTYTHVPNKNKIIYT